MQRWDTLTPGGYRFVYDDTVFPPGTDTFLLSSLPQLKPRQRVCDLGSGCGLLGLLLLARQPDLQVTGIEIQENAVRLARQTAEYNHLTNRLVFHQSDLRTVKDNFPSGHFDLVVCNPPYYPAGAGYLPLSATGQTARAETACTLEDVCRSSAYLLRWGGRFCLVHKPERLTDVLCALRASGLEPKRLRLVMAQPASAPSLLLVEGRRGGNPGLAIEPPLILQQADGTPTPELDAIYFRQQEVSP